MTIQSELTPKRYLAAMRNRMEPFTSFGAERFTGLFLGSCFSVAFHSGYEWNRRITNEKNRAIGYVKKTDSGSEVRFVLLKGCTNPLSLIGFFAVYYAIIWITASLNGVGFDPVLWTVFSAVGAVLTALATALEAVFTDRGEEGREILLAMLEAPEFPGEE